MRSDDLLAGPRGRRLCWELLRLPFGPADPSDVTLAVAACRDRLVAGGEHARDLLLSGLRASVGAARYWQDPDEEDLLLAAPSAAAALAPLAAAIVDNEHARWWSTGADLNNQVLLRWPRARSTPRAAAIDELHRWRAETLAENEAMQRTRVEGGEARWAITSAAWWTPPHGVSFTSTTRVLEPFGPVGLWLAEDDAGDEHARSWPVRAPLEARVFEVVGPSSWEELVRRYPLDVTYARGANWLQATGRDGGWLIPDWSAVASDYDAVHLTVQGYLATSGRVVAIDDRMASFIAGWDPDQTIWLTDVPEDGPASDWTFDDSDELWSRADTATEP